MGGADKCPNADKLQTMWTALTTTNKSTRDSSSQIVPIVKNTIGLYTSQKTSKNYKYSKEKTGQHTGSLYSAFVRPATPIFKFKPLSGSELLYTPETRGLFTQEPWTTSGKTGLCFCRRLTFYTLLDTIALTKICLQTCKQNKKKTHKVMLLWLPGGDFASLSLWLDGNNLYVINYTQSIFHSVITSLYGYKDHFA